MDGGRGISSFSVLLITAVASIIGMCCFSFLKVQYTPSSPGRTLVVKCNYPNASPRVVEAEVTSKIEGALSSINGCKDIESDSEIGKGSVTMTVKKNADLDAVRFEIASRIRNIYSGLPDGCSYPLISYEDKSTPERTAIIFNFKSTLPPKEIADFINGKVMVPLSTMEGVSFVRFNGQNPFEWVITFDADAALSYGLSSEDIALAFNDYFSDDVVGLSEDESGQAFSVRLRNGSDPDFGAIPVGRVEGRTIHLGDLATWKYVESVPTSYYRLNGLNTVALSVGAGPDENIITVVKDVKARMAELGEMFPEEINAEVGYDYSEYMSDELDKIYFRTFLCLALLLLFVFVLNRSWRYMFVIAVTLAVNLLVSVMMYYFFGLQIHIYTLAGITVSLGIIIDNSIVMIDHFLRHKDRSVFPALLGAVLTTVAALLAVLLLPEKEKENLTDFSLVIIINLAVSLLVAFFFVPALMDYFPLGKEHVDSRKPGRMRRIVRWNEKYRRYIEWGVMHKWVLAVALVAMFGIPTCLLKPQQQSYVQEKVPLTRWQRVVDKVCSFGPYANNKDVIDAVLGTSFNSFHKALNRSNFYREPERPVLFINAGMAEGCTVQQLNEVIRSMENYLSQFDEIEMFETNVWSYRSGNIKVFFKPEYENTAIPSRLKSDVTAMAINFGGANWGISGVDDSYFNNNIVSNWKNNSICLKGYNYDELLGYAYILMDYLKTNRRVSGPEVWGKSYSSRPLTEFYLRYDSRPLLNVDVSPQAYYSALNSPLCDTELRQVLYNGEFTRVRLESSLKDSFDYWSVLNEPVSVGDSKIKLSDIGSITKTKTNLPIEKENQSYVISVAYDFIGPGEMSKKFSDSAIAYMNGSILPVGYSAYNRTWSGWMEERDKYAGLILLVILAIFVICSIQFESLRLPFAVILLVPLSFVGEFLVFGLTDFTFDKGGFAAFIMLCGIAVNSGIYLICEWQRRGRGLKNYIRSFNAKIWPVLLTVLSTVLGLIPFLFDGPSEVFWFAFAVGTMAGLFMSLVAFVFFLPVFCLKKKDILINSI